MTNPKDLDSGRRRFLKQLAVGTGGATLLGAGGLGALSQLARGADGAGEERFYVFCYFSGGWDVLLGLDPRDPGRFNEDSLGETRIQPNYGNQASAQFQEAPAFADGTQIPLGPAAAPLARWGSRLTVVRGMSMDTLTHEAGRRRFITGKPPSGLQARGSAGSAWLASQFSGERLIPNLSVRVESFNPELSSEVSALRVSSATDLVAMLRRAEPSLDPALDEAISRFALDESSCARAQSSPTLRQAETSRRRMRAVLEADVQALFDFRTDPASIEDPEFRAKMERVFEKFGLSGRDATSPAAQAAIAAQALTNGVARVVSIQAAGGLDTHFDDWADEQAPRQYGGFDAISKLAEFLQESECPGAPGESMLDRTTIVAFSEFMRTPLMNARGGRDHWLTNSCMLLGGKLRHGQPIGASSDLGMAPQPVDLATGQVTPGGQVIYPEHILRTLLVDAGMSEDRADLRVDPLGVLLPG